MKNNNAIRTIERMNNIINEMKELRNEFESMLNQLNNNEKELLVNDDHEDLDSYENIPEEELEGLIDEEYLSWVEANFGDEEINDEEDDDEDEDEEPEIYDIYLSIEEFETLNEYVTDIPFGYTFDSTENEYLIKMDDDMVYEIGEILEQQAYIEEYEECCRPRYERIVAVQNAIYYGVHYNL